MSEKQTVNSHPVEGGIYAIRRDRFCVIALGIDELGDERFVIRFQGPSARDPRYQTILSWKTLTWSRLYKSARLVAVDVKLLMSEDRGRGLELGITPCTVIQKNGKVFIVADILRRGPPSCPTLH